MTPADTSTKANSVPTLTISRSLAIGNTDAVTATSTVMRTGVPRGAVLANPFWPNGLCAGSRSAIAFIWPRRRPGVAGDHNPTVALNNFVGSRASRRIGASSAATQAAIPRRSVSDPDLPYTVVQPSVHNKTCGPS